jgi:DNA repair protein RadC
MSENLQSFTGYSIQQLPESDRPRERFLQHGPEAMSSAELIAILLGSGTQGMPVLKLAHEIVTRFGGLKQLAEATIEELCQIRGVGLAKAVQLKACFNLGLRVSKQDVSQKYRIENPLHAYHLLKDELQKETREVFVTILLDTKGGVITHLVVSIGTLSNTLVHPREVFYPAIRHKAASIILAHNHPSGDPTPSQEDYEVTKDLIRAGHLMGIPVNDHIIIGGHGYTSLRQKGMSFTVSS